MKPRKIVFSAFAVLMLAGAVLGDRGAIVTVGEVDIEEPAQRAIIAYNGFRELLILQTDVKADRETKVVEFMPLPSKPTVSLAPKGCFAALAEIIKAHNLRYVIRYTTKDRAEGAKEEAVKVVVAAHLGPHAVTVVEVKDAAAFVEWVRAFFKKNDLGEPNLGENLRLIVADYLKRGLRFFAFDIVTLSPEKKTVQPLTYEFETDHFYYPLKVTNLYGGSGTIELITILPRWFSGREKRFSVRPAGAGSKPAGHPPWRWLRSREAEVPAAEVARLHKAIPDLLHGESAVLSAVKYQGPLHFDRDVWVPQVSPIGACLMFVRCLEARDEKVLQPLVDVPFAFDRKQVVLDRTELMRRFEALFKRPRPAQPLQIDRIAHKTLRDLSSFDREFVTQHGRGEQGYIPYFLEVAMGEERLIVLLRVEHQEGYKVVGFSG